MGWDATGARSLAWGETRLMKTGLAGSDVTGARSLAWGETRLMKTGGDWGESAVNSSGVGTMSLSNH